MSAADIDALAEQLGGEAPQQARRAIAGVARETPVLVSGTLSERCGGSVVLKAENLQRTGSFKLRGALNRVAGLEPGSGVVAGSAGNHAQALAYAASARGIACEVFMPIEAAVAKVAAVQAYGGKVTLGGDSVDDCVAAARTRAQETGAVFVHPFDDPQVILGQATLGLELLDQVPDLATVIVPLGGGGLIAGLAGAVKHARPQARIVGVQVAACAPFPAALAAGTPVAVKGAPTIADGIAVKRPGELTLPLVERFVDEVVVVSEEDTAEAMVLLMERAKLVVEGAGAVGVAALLAELLRPAAEGTTVVVLSGGNVDAGLLALVARRHETAVGRRLRVFTRVADRPGGLAALLLCVAAAGGNLLGVTHVREAVDLQVRQTGVELTLETRGAEHAEAIVAAMIAGGYEVERV
ncbi:MAG TPA: threonine ammonia-lyase [Solirubrobacteraceae bacterium]|nr:threonine ammonia-lyase [Solirubrobacteraceae bacterium]